MIRRNAGSGANRAATRFSFMVDALLIDARNAIYRAVYAVKADRRHTTKYHYFVILLRQLSSWINAYRPNSVHIFWDAPRTTVWRRKILDTYKDRSNSQYVEDISEELALTTHVAQEIFTYMNVRQYDRKGMEADDLIYAAVSILHPKKNVIVSTDSDMVQIPYTFSSSTVYDPKKRTEMEIPCVNPVMQKALVGDKADSIDGYRGIGPKKSEAMLKNPPDMDRFLKTVDKQIYYRNMLLIDLSLNPRLLANKMYVQRIMFSEPKFDDQAINELTEKYKVTGLLTEYADLVYPFKKLQ